MYMKNYFFLLAIFFIITACNKPEEPKFDIYENHNISACGMEDPLRNLDWLSEFTTENRDIAHGNVSYIKVELYANVETMEEYIVIFHFPEGGGCSGCEPPNWCDWHHIYFCSGERMFIDGEGIVNFLDWNEFFYSGKNKSQGIIWYRNKIN